MVEKQIEARGVRNQAVLNAMRKVPRHLFVPADMLESAYNDTPLSIGHGQTISQPYIVALMTELLQLTSTQKVLEIGTGSGYQTAVLAELVKTLYSIEIVEPLVEPTQKLLQSLGYTNVVSMYGDGYQGWPEYAPFDGIIVTAAPSLIPKPLIQQLTMGGRMVIPVGDYHQDLILLTKTESGLQRRNVTAVRFVPMTGEVEKQDAYQGEYDNE